MTASTADEPDADVGERRAASSPTKEPGRSPVGLDPNAVRRALREAGLRARHALSQNFLTDVEVLERIVAEAAPAPGRRILEIGPGLGVLTGALLAQGASVVAIELDEGLEARLAAVFEAEIEAGRRDRLGPGSLQLVRADALDVDLGALIVPPFDVVANLPYHITSPILHRLLGAEPRPRRAVLMVQREVAERIAARPGAMSYLSVFVQYHARVRLAFGVPATSFEPEPAVESAVVVVEPFVPTDQGAPVDRGAPPRLDAQAEAELWRLVQAAFRERRKMLHNVLARQLPLSAERVANALEIAGIAGDRRPQTVSVEEWLRLRTALGELGPDARGRRRAGRPEGSRPESA
ncbi:MAG TPA: 16S rRNA (adenine(1518)-N(6)/adenine(1519)-N(6))-dimethyltransferase RsmA [Candidatus Limnocylindrales bacterium]